MKVLLDENLPHGLRKEIQGHEVFTASHMGWAGIGNGKLLSLAANAGFNVLITNDRGLEYQQNQRSLPVAIIVILTKTNTIEGIRPIYAMLHCAINQVKPGQLLKVG